MRGNRDSPTLNYTNWSTLTLPKVQAVKIKGAKQISVSPFIDLSQDYPHLKRAIAIAPVYKIIDKRVEVGGSGVVFLFGQNMDELHIREHGNSLWVFGVLQDIKNILHEINNLNGVSRWDVTNTNIHYRVIGDNLYMRYSGKNLSLKGVSSGRVDVHHLIENSSLSHLILHSSVCRPVLRGNGHIKIYIYNVKGFAAAVPVIEATGKTLTASHAVKTVTLDHNQRFYLQTRGIESPETFYVAKLFDDILGDLYKELLSTRK